MAPIGSKLCQNAFQGIPDVSFFDGENNFFSKFSQTLTVRLPPEDGSDWPETWPKRVSGDPRTFTFWRRRPKNFRIFRSRSSCFGQDTCVLAQDTFFRNIFGAKNHTTGLIRVVWFHTTSWKSHTSHYVINSMTTSETIENQFKISRLFFFRERPDAFECVPMHPNASQQVRMDPNGS